MKLNPFYNPKTGKKAVAMLESLYALAHISDPDESGHVQYLGESDFLYDTQEPAFIGENTVLLVDEDGDQWEAQIER